MFTPIQNIVYAVATTLTPSQGDYILDNPTLSDVSTLINYAIDFLLGISGGVAIFFVFWGASQYIWGWNVETKQKGKTKIIGAIFGIIVVTLSFLVVRVLTTDINQIVR